MNQSTESLSDESTSADLVAPGPYLILALECVRPESGSSRYSLFGIDHVRIGRGECESHREVAAAASAAKKQAKKRAKDAANEPFGGSLFVERRRVGNAEAPYAAGRVWN